MARIATEPGTVTVPERWQHLSSRAKPYVIGVSGAVSAPHSSRRQRS